jgi:hypothetical protein
MDTETIHEGNDRMDVNRMILIGIIITFIYFIFIALFTLLFRLSGLTKSKARFQVISMFTNSGFTTDEAELITNHRMRRKLASFTMLFGFLLNVAVISVLVNVILTLGQSESKDIWKFVGVVGSFYVFLTIISKIKPVEQLLQRITKAIAVKFLYGKDINVIEVLDHYRENSIAEISVKHLPEILEGKTLQESPVKNEFGIQILAIQRGREVNAQVGGSDDIKKGDIVVAYGTIRNIRRLFLREKITQDEEDIQE